ncbi:MAG: hypothetical protein FWJ89_09580, partial [Limnochorda sp.]
MPLAGEPRPAGPFREARTSRQRRGGQTSAIDPPIPATQEAAMSTNTLSMAIIGILALGGLLGGPTPSP